MREKAAEFGVELDAAGVDRALERLKVLEHRGYAFEAADASFELLLRTEAGEIEPLFALEALRVITEKRADGRVRPRPPSSCACGASASCRRPRATAR